FQDRGLSRRRRHAPPAVRLLLPPRVSGPLELARALLGLPVPWIAFRARRHRPERAGDRSAGAGTATRGNRPRPSKRESVTAIGALRAPDAQKAQCQRDRMAFFSAITRSLSALASTV